LALVCTLVRLQIIHFHGHRCSQLSAVAIVPSGLLAGDFLDLHQVSDLVDRAAKRGGILANHALVQLGQAKRTHRALLVAWAADGAPHQRDAQVALSGRLRLAHGYELLPPPRGAWPRPPPWFPPRPRPPWPPR